MIRAGMLRHTITIERAHEITNDAGTKVTTWTAHATVRAEIVDPETVELVEQTGTSETETVIFRLRHLELTSADRVRHGARIFNIKRILALGTYVRGLELTCEC